MNSIVFIDSEIDIDNGKILDLGAVKPDGTQFHSASCRDFVSFVSSSDFFCGHNIIAHDLKYIGKLFETQRTPFPIDTLPVAPLLFPSNPYHALLKDDKLQTDSLNNPLNDSIKARDLFYDEINAFNELPSVLKRIYCALLYPFLEFQGFFKYNGFRPYMITDKVIKKSFYGKICTNADITTLIRSRPIELAYVLALIFTGDRYSITPPWVVRNYPEVENLIKTLRNTPCTSGCSYCKNKMDVTIELKRIFNYDSFRTYNGEPLQERAANAAVHGKSLLAVFPTGGGKSITFQLPALMAGEAVHGLTVVISPLQSLMKDQVDNLEIEGIVDAVTINGLLNVVERSEALKRVKNGLATILYISPEQLRSKTILRLLLSRNIVRFVIDEAHCFSAWGHDFRVDYLYIGDFIREFQKEKRLTSVIPVSCFTATAKQKVIRDICDYFEEKLGLNLELFTTTADRENLHYAVLYKETEEEKYNQIRTLIEEKNCPTIVYVSRTRRTFELAEKLTNDGFVAKPFNGRMESGEKISNQEAFIQNDIQVIVATSAFGMGVDKKDVKLVIHYDISDSLENYVQEAGRAGRDQSLQADCYVLFNDSDLDKHFILLNQTKLSINEIRQIWKAIKDLTRFRPTVCCSALELARQAGWDDSVAEIETRVKTAIAALENAGYIKRGRNMPRVYATSILVKNMQEAEEVIRNSKLFNDIEKQNARRIIKALISSRSIAKTGNDDAESRVDYLSDMLGIKKSEVISILQLMRESNLLDDSLDMCAFIRYTDTQNKSAQILGKFSGLERFLLMQLVDEGSSFNLKDLNERAQEAGFSFSSVKNLRTILYYWTIKGYIHKSKRNSDKKMDIYPTGKVEDLQERFEQRIGICSFLVEELYKRAKEDFTEKREEVPVQFSLLGIWRAYQQQLRLELYHKQTTSADIEDALLYLSKIAALSLEGGFLVLYNGIEIKRLITDNKIRYKVDDYRMLNEFYKQKIQQIHIVGEYANLMVRDYDAALNFVKDYFQIDFKQFISKYFKGDRIKEMNRNITPKKYKQLFGELSAVQSEIIHDEVSKYVVVAAGPGSGKTRVLVHKLAALLLLDDVKHEQLLMLTFSRAAATEFKKRLIDLIGNAAYFVDIMTFHSYCFDLLGKIGTLDDSENVVEDAAKMINNGEVELGRITKSVIVIDEAQDIDKHEFALIQALIKRNDDMRIIAVGDDNQNIYEFRGSDSKYMKSLVTEYDATLYEMVENYRSKPNVIALANALSNTITNRMRSNPIQAVRKEMGSVQLIRYGNTNLEEPVVNQVMLNHKKGTACVLTCTNEEALHVVGLFIQRGKSARLIQSNDEFRLYNLCEIRFFIKEIDKRLASPVISESLWEHAKTKLKEVYGNSSCLDICLRLILDFEVINRTKYRTDLEEFVKESKYEDFYTVEEKSILVSTIHKSKGREFDSVYMLLNHLKMDTDEMRRQVYVGLTRAKQELFIHYNQDIFKEVDFKGVNNQEIEQLQDNRQYLKPKELILSLSYKDVVLNFFKDKKKIIFKLCSGEELFIDGDFLCAEIENKVVKVAMFSKERQVKLEKLQKEGIYPYKAVIRFIVAWRGKEDKVETPVILLDLFLRKNKPLR